MATEQTRYGEWLKIGFLVSILVWMIALFELTSRWGNAQNWLFPRSATVLSALLIVLTISVTVVQSRYDIDWFDDEDDQSERDDTEGSTDENTAITILSVLLFPVFIHLFGFYLASIYILGMAWLFTRDWKKSVIAGVVYVALIFTLFYYLLDLDLGGGIVGL